MKAHYSFKNDHGSHGGTVERMKGDGLWVITAVAWTFFKAWRNGGQLRKVEIEVKW